MARLSPTDRTSPADFIGRPKLATINVIKDRDDAHGAWFLDLIKRDRSCGPNHLRVPGMASSLCSRCRRRIERQVFARQTEVLLKHTDDQGMVLALRQTGDGDRTEAPCSLEENRETTAVGRKVL